MVYLRLLNVAGFLMCEINSENPQKSVMTTAGPAVHLLASGIAEKSDERAFTEDVKFVVRMYWGGFLRLKMHFSRKEDAVAFVRAMTACGLPNGRIVIGEIKSATTYFTDEIVV